MTVKVAGCCHCPAEAGRILMAVYLGVGVAQVEAVERHIFRVLAESGLVCDHHEWRTALEVVEADHHAVRDPVVVKVCVVVRQAVVVLAVGEAVVVAVEVCSTAV